MALYGGRRDTSLFRSVNRELIKHIIQTEVDIIKISIQDTETNLYGESKNKIYYQDVRLACLIKLESSDLVAEEYGPNTTQACRFAFLRDDLVLANILPEAGDLIDWNGALWEINKTIDSSLFLGRNPDYNKTIDGYDFNDIAVHQFGWNYAFIVETHMTRKTRTNLENMYSGNPDNLR